MANTIMESWILLRAHLEGGRDGGYYKDRNDDWTVGTKSYMSLLSQARHFIMLKGGEISMVQFLKKLLEEDKVMYREIASYPEELAESLYESRWSGHPEDYPAMVTVVVESMINTRVSTQESFPEKLAKQVMSRIRTLESLYGRLNTPSFKMTFNRVMEEKITLLNVRASAPHRTVHRSPPLACFRSFWRRYG